MIFAYVYFFVGVKGLFELVQTAHRRGVGSVVTFRTWLKDLAKKNSVGNGKSAPQTCVVGPR